MRSQYRNDAGMISMKTLTHSEIRVARSGADTPFDIAVVVLEPSTWLLLLLGLTVTFGLKPLLRRLA